MAQAGTRIDRLLKQISPKLATGIDFLREHVGRSTVADDVAQDIEQCETDCSTCGAKLPGGACEDGSALNPPAASHADIAEVTRSCGTNMNAWFPCAISDQMPKKDVREVVLFGESICLWRGEHGDMFAIEDRCAHRHLRLSKGQVDVDNVTCCYHGWEYNGIGKVVKFAHEIPKSFKSTPDIRIRYYPVKEKFGLVWVFPGDPMLAESTPLTRFALLSDDKSCIVRYTSELTHVNHLKLLNHVHELLPSTADMKVTRNGDEVHAVAKGQYHLRYKHPCVEVQFGDAFMQYVFFVPIDDDTTQCLSVFVWPSALMPQFVQSSIHVRSYRAAVRDFQKLCARIGNTPSFSEMEPTPGDVGAALRRVVEDLWQRYRDSEQKRAKSIRRSQWKLTRGAGLNAYSWAHWQ